MGVGRSLVKLTVGFGCVLGGLALTPALTGVGVVFATGLGNVAAGIAANALDALTVGKEPDKVSLENADLTKAVGKAIAAVITLAAKQHRGKTHDNLEKIAIQAKNNWVKIAQQELTQQRYPQLREAKLDRFLTPEEYSLTQDGNLTPQEWQDIFIRLNMAACKGGGFQLPPEVCPEVADLLHSTFPKALRETLKEDFEKDGKAFAGFTLQLLTGMKAELAQLRNNNLGVNAAELTQILQEFQQLETQLRGTVAQQQAFFRQISQDIDSGFAEVCQQLGVMETNITELLQNLEKRLDALDQKLARLEAQGGGRQISREESRNRQHLLKDMRAELAGRKPLHQAVLLNLGKEQQPHQVQRHWDASVKVGEQRSFQLPSETSILEVFENPAINGKFLILGKPGGGKTTTLLELAQALVERAEMNSDAPIPVILELSEWQTITKRKFPDFWKQEKYDPSIKEWILSQLRSKGVSQEIGKQWIKEKELVLLLDGLDELRSERQAKCVRAINQFLDSEFSPLHLVVCSRKEEYENYEEVLHLNGAICLEDLSVEQIQHYFASVNLGEFWESIKDSEKIVNFIRQPLFLAITSIAYQQIDVEEWRKCITEERAIDYLLGIFRGLALSKGSDSNLIFSKGGKTRLINRSLTWLAKYLQTTGYSDFIFYEIKPSEQRYNESIKSHETQVLLFEGFAYYKAVNSFIRSLEVCFWIYISFYFLGRDYLHDLFWSDFLTSVPGYITFGFLSFLFALLFYLVDFYEKDNHLITINQVNLLENNNFYLFLKEFFLVLFLSIMVGLFIFIVSDLLLIIISLPQIILAILDGSFIKGLLDGSLIKFSYYAIVTLTFLTFSLPILSVPIVLSGACQSGLSKETKKKCQEPLTPIYLILNVLYLTIFCFFYYASINWVLRFLLGLDFYLFPWYIVVIPSVYIGIFLGGGYELFKYFVLRVILFKFRYMPWNITRFLDYCTERLILQRVGDRYRFIHRLVQEHFANLEIQKE